MTVCVVVGGLVLVTAGVARADGSSAVVFVEPATGELTGTLRDALSAQLSGAETELRFARFTEDASTLRRQVTEARALAAANHAVGVFWLDAPVGKDWLLYLAEAGGDRVLVRRITVEADGSAAATEAVAVIAAESSQALARGQTIGMQVVVLPADASPRPAVEKAETGVAPAATPPASVAQQRPVSPVFVGLSYYGDGPAPEIRWQSGARLSLGVRVTSALYVNAGFVFFKEATVRGPNLTFQVTRSPVDLGVGVELARGRWVPALEVRAVAEVLSRDSIAATGALQGTANSTRLMGFVSPRARLTGVISPSFGLFVAAGVDVATNPFPFVTRVDGRDQPLLSPAAVRPAVELGASFSL